MRLIDQCSKCNGGMKVAPEDSCFVNPLPIDRNTLIIETKDAYRPILSALKNGWSLSAKKKFPELYARRHEMSKQAEGIIVIRDQTLIPPSCRVMMLKHLHSGHETK